MCSSKTSQRHAIGRAADVVEPNTVESLDRVRIATVLTANATDDVGVALMTELNTHLNELSNAGSTVANGLYGKIRSARY